MKKSRIQGSWAASSNRASDQTVNFLVNQRPAHGVVEYVENNSKPMIKPDVKIIQNAGEHLLSSGPSGESKIVYYPNFFDCCLADHYFAALSNEIPWSQKSDDFGLQNRLTAWYGQHPYSYAGLTHEAHDEWHLILLEMLSQIEEKLLFDNQPEDFNRPKLNSVLCNFYRNNRDGVGWHSDDEPELRGNPFIASVSLGETRVFEMRKKPTEPPLDDFTFSEKVKLNLVHGSLLIMKGCTQDDWQHRVPTEYHDKQPRINLTFRTIFPVNQ